jgi:hypothetical protein
MTFNLFDDYWVVRSDLAKAYMGELKDISGYLLVIDHAPNMSYL